MEETRFSYVTMREEPLDAARELYNEECWSNVLPDDLDRLTSGQPPRRRCPWCHCFRHTAICSEIHDLEDGTIELPYPGQDEKTPKSRRRTLRIKTNGWYLKMPLGKYKGAKVIDLPPDYLRWMYLRKIPRTELKLEIERVLLDTEHEIKPWEKY